MGTKKSLGDLRIKITMREEISLDFYEESSVEPPETEYTTEGKLMLPQKKPLKVGETLMTIIGWNQQIWENVDRFFSQDHNFSKLYSETMLANYLGTPLRSLNLQNNGQSVNLEEVLAIQYYLAFHSKYNGACEQLSPLSTLLSIKSEYCP
ncbi:MAG: hypothetical protein Q8L27_00850 [archaeon]|nr:hypothetical protein [archaeon]